LAKKGSSQIKEFGGRLKQLRETRSMKVADLAKLVNASPAAIWHWEHRGTRPRNGTIDAIAQVLGVTRSFLETGKPLNGGIHSDVADRVQTAGDQMSLEQLMRAIEARGFEVYVKSKGDLRS